MKESYEKGIAIHSAPSFALAAARQKAKRKQGTGGLGYRASKTSNRDADTIGMVEGNMSQDASASPGAVPRSRRTQSTSGNFMHENRETSAIPAEPEGQQDGERRPRP